MTTLTIGMACYDDPDGVWATMQDLARAIRREQLLGIELLVVDNHPESIAGEVTRKDVAKFPAARYIPMREPVGTAPPRNRVFAEARGDWVLCLDSHVLLDDGVLGRLLAWIQGRNDRDLFHGPVLDEGTHEVSATHQVETWGDGMFGVWELAELLLDPEADPQPIAMSGCGLFLCRKDAWLGFHPEFREFGGEEGYIHQKFRAAGQHVMCLPWLRFIHHFRESPTTPYPQNWRSRARNYLLSYQELNYPDWDDMYAELVRTGRVKREAWSELCAETGAEPRRPRAASSLVASPTAKPGVVDPSQFACRHRLPVIRTDLCDLCGIRGQTFEVHGCQVHGECSVNRRQMNLRSCVLCPDRDATGAAEVPVSAIAPANVTPPAKVTIVIAARNNGPFLAEAITSALNQSHPCEVIYVDDASSDDSLAIARSFEDRGLIVLEPVPHAGVCSARNRGADFARGDSLCFLDGDDVMPRGFIALHLAAMCTHVPFVYGPAEEYGGPHSGNVWPVPEWQDYDRWSSNTVNTSALYARWAFEGAGRWSDAVPTMWDWDLALRACRLGTPRPSAAKLLYRQHPASWSHLIGEKKGRLDMQALVRRRNASLGLGAVLSGRLPELLPRWFDELAASLRWWQPGRAVKLALIDNSRNESFGRLLRDCLARHRETFAPVRVIASQETWPAEQTRWESPDWVAGFMARSCQMLSDALGTDLVWLVEDDILPPIEAAQQLWERLTLGLNPPAITAAPYRNRHDRSRYVGGYWYDGHPDELQALPSGAGQDEAMPVEIVGTGCAMFWRERAADFSRSHTDQPRYAAHDWAWSLATRQLGRDVILLPLAKCAHVAAMDDVIAA